MKIEHNEMRNAILYMQARYLQDKLFNDIYKHLGFRKNLDFKNEIYRHLRNTLV